LRWLSRYLAEGKAVTLLKALVAASSLAELRSVEREHAARLLVELAQLILNVQVCPQLVRRILVLTRLPHAHGAGQRLGHAAEAISAGGSRRRRAVKQKPAAYFAFFPREYRPLSP